ncbi:hypothetical protein BC567DRAFT_46601 [Phyllosticta citribraziliensis]
MMRMLMMIFQSRYFNALYAVSSPTAAAPIVVLEDEKDSSPLLATRLLSRGSPRGVCSQCKVFDCKACMSSMQRHRSHQPMGDAYPSRHTRFLQCLSSRPVVGASPGLPSAPKVHAG